MKFLKNLFYLVTVLGLGLALTSATVDQTKKKKEYVNYEGGNSYTINKNGQIKVPFSYKVKSGRKIVVSLHDSDGKWLNGKQMDLEKGAGEIELPIGYKKKGVKIGKDYQIRYHIRKTGKEFTWKDALDTGSKKGISTTKR